ncbi:hypothetical protein SEA_EYRE_68 [Gordonia phage Eyre]|uniref:Uncharacterized protein n=1 Tax=Gordonia phage Eyre TaxID=1887646 RepID=A0A1B3AZZ9_9CAUD|nr:hypothetical protein BIZ73_gp68 [Gordonia phage Eyre]AOE44347.1 hypothetical protein SEA_EYRE_68 [Gordonia phage Eyre]
MPEFANGGMVGPGAATFGECHGGECGGHWEREQICRPGHPPICTTFYVCGYGDEVFIPFIPPEGHPRSTEILAQIQERFGDA